MTVKTFRSDRGGEFTSDEFDSYYKANGMNRNMTAPNSPQQNGIVERQNRILLEMTRNLLKHMTVPNTLLGEAARHATYLLKIFATRSFLGQTPYEALRHKKPNIDHLKVFRCVCYARTKIACRKKLDDRSKILVHFGTEPGSKAYRQFDPSNKKIVVSRDVYFKEEKQWHWNDKDGTKPKQSSFEIDLIPLKGTDDYSKTQDDSENEDDEEEVTNEDDDDDEEYGDDSPRPNLRRSNRVSTKPSYLDEYILLAEVECETLLMIVNNELWDYNEAKDLKIWVDACKEELNSIEKNNT